MVTVIQFGDSFVSHFNHFQDANSYLFISLTNWAHSCPDVPLPNLHIYTFCDSNFIGGLSVIRVLSVDSIVSGYLVRQLSHNRAQRQR